MPVSILYQRTFNPLTLPAGARATPGTVGYRGSEGALTVLNPGDTPPAGMSWDGFIFRINDGAPFTLDHYKVNAGLWVYNTAAVTISNCVVRPPLSDPYGIVSDTGSAGDITIEDTTVVCQSTPTTGAQVVDAGISLDCLGLVRRCDVSLTGDGIHMTGITGSKVTQCCVHSLQYIDVDQHLDGIQWFNYSAAAGTAVVEHSYVEGVVHTGSGNPMNSSLTCGLPNLTPPNDTAPRMDIALINNFWGGGDYMLRCGWRLGLSGVEIRDNDWAQPPGTGFLGLFYVEEPTNVLKSSTTGWDNNRDYQDNLIDDPR